jgi:hypothetical protein
MLATWDGGAKTYTVKSLTLPADSWQQFGIADSTDKRLSVSNSFTKGGWRRQPVVPAAQRAVWPRLFLDCTIGASGPLCLNPISKFLQGLSTWFGDGN